MSFRTTAVLLMIVLAVAPATGAQKTVLYEHFTAVW